MSIELKPNIKQELRLKKVAVVMTITAIFTITALIVLNGKSEESFATNNESGSNTVEITIPEVAIMDIESSGS